MSRGKGYSEDCLWTQNLWDLVVYLSLTSSFTRGLVKIRCEPLSGGGLLCELWTHAVHQPDSISQESVHPVGIILWTSVRPGLGKDSLPRPTLGPDLMLPRHPGICCPCVGSHSVFLQFPSRICASRGGKMHLLRILFQAPCLRGSTRHVIVN